MDVKLIKTVKNNPVMGILSFSALFACVVWFFYFRLPHSGWVEDKKWIYHNIPSRLFFSSPSTTQTQKLISGAWKEFDRIGLIANAFSPSSELGIINSNKNKKSLMLSDDLANLVRDSEFVNKISEGAFDPTVWPIKMLWNKARERNSPPTSEELNVARSSVGMHLIHLTDSGQHHELQVDRPDIQFDFGGIAKGYAVDKVREYLVQNGVREGLVQCGGEISAWSDSGREWKIGIQHPKDAKMLWGVIKAKGAMRISTSANYQQPIVIQNKEYYHIFDPRTAWPVGSRILSVTLASFSGSISNALIDAFTKSILVLGEQRGLEIVHNLGLEALVIVDKDGEMVEFMTDGIRSHYQREKWKK